MDNSPPIGLPRIADRLKQAIHRADPFAGFDPAGLGEDLQGWFCHSEVVDVIVDGLRPNIIVEIGTWKGVSTAYLAKAMRRHHDDCAILCVDTWLGSAEHWLNPEWHRLLNCRSGYPGLYRQFLVNMIHEGLQDVVVPLPLPSHQAALILETYGIQTTMIYLDGGHDFRSVLQDLIAFWPRLAANGVLLGDDYSPAWPGLIGAVKAFRESYAESIADFRVIGAGFILRKT